MQETALKTVPKSISWEAPEYEYKKKGADWYFSLAIIVISVVIAALVFGNPLFALLLTISGLALFILASKKPSIVSYAVSVRGVRIDDHIYPFSTLKSYYIDEEDSSNPQMLILTKRHLLPVLSFPIPIEHVDDIEDLMHAKLKEEHLEESVVMRMLENFGF